MVFVITIVHDCPLKWCWCIAKGSVCLTFFFFWSSAWRSSRCFSWLLRFFNRVSGTRICSSVGTLLCLAKKGKVSIVCPVEDWINTSSRELQLRRCILGLEHRLDEMNLIGETGTFATKLPSTEVKAFCNRTNAFHPTRPQAMLKNDTRTCSSLPWAAASMEQAIVEGRVRHWISRRKRKPSASRPHCLLQTSQSWLIGLVRSILREVSSWRWCTPVYQRFQRGGTGYTTVGHENFVSKRLGEMAYVLAVAWCFLGGILAVVVGVRCRCRCVVIIGTDFLSRC